MSNRSIHCRLGVIDKVGNLIIVSLKTTGDNIDMSTKSGVNTINHRTLQELINSLGSIAYNKTFMGIDDNSTSSTVKTWSANKILKTYDDITVINNKRIAEFERGCQMVINKIISEGYDIDGSITPSNICDYIDIICNNYYNRGIPDGFNAALENTTADKDDVLLDKLFCSKKTIYGEIDATATGSMETYKPGNVVLAPGEKYRFSKGYYQNMTVNTWIVSSISVTTKLTDDPNDGLPTCKIPFQFSDSDSEPTVNILWRATLPRRMLKSEFKVLSYGIVDFRFDMNTDMKSLDTYHVEIGNMRTEIGNMSYDGYYDYVEFMTYVPMKGRRVLQEYSYDSDGDGIDDSMAIATSDLSEKHCSMELKTAAVIRYMPEISS